MKKTNNKFLSIATAALVVIGLCCYFYEEYKVELLDMPAAESCCHGDAHADFEPEVTCSRVDDGVSGSGAAADGEDTMTVEDALDVMSRLELPQWTRTDTAEIVDHMGYMVNYNTTLLIPNWVAYRLSELELLGDVSRSSKFKTDPDIKGLQACDNDYRNSGWDRGHMAPAADMKWSSQAMYESFYLTNVCPQNANLNRGDWKELEEKVRELALKYHDVYVVCGPVMKTGEFGKIGENGVAVPDAFFKALMVKTDNGEYSAAGFIMANKPGNRKLTAYVCPVDSVEACTGLDLFHNLPDALEDKMEASVDLSVWNL
ncbi:MAG: DNA/RNA non-specific endonuclease [Bacteroidales bacterium]|nr:DNA/RNA non-specific endonuclease [Bacteroidales bacterium]